MDEKRKKSFGILKILIIAVILILLAMIAIPFVVDANQFRPIIESKLSAALGRTVKVGNLRLSLLGGSIDADAISIADDRSFSSAPFVTARSLHVGVEMTPLIFSRAVKVTSISLVNPEVTLIRTASGTWNFSSLGSGSGGAPAGRHEDNGTQSPAVDVSIRQLNVSGGRVTIVRGAGHLKPYLLDKVDLKVQNLSFATVFPVLLTASLPGGGAMKLEGKAGPLNTADLSRTPLDAGFTLTRMDLVGSGIIDATAGLGGVVDLKSTFTSDSRQLRIQGSASVDKLQLVKSGSPAGRLVSLEFTLSHDLNNQSGKLDEARVSCNQAVANLQGTYALGNDEVVLKLRLRGEGMPVQDLDALLPAAGVVLPRGASLQGGTLSLEANSGGPIENLVTTGTIDLSGTRLTGYDLGAKVAAMASVAGFKTGPSTDIEKLSSGVRVTQDGIRLDGFTLIAPSLGQLTGDGTVSPSHSLDFKMQARLNASGGIAGELARLTGGNSLGVPFFIRGTAEDPKFVPDVKGAAAGLLGPAAGKDGKPAENTLGGVLNNLFGKKKK